MKNSFKLFMVLVVATCLFLTGCGKSLSKYAGTYEGVYSKFVGDPDTAKSEEEFKLVLESNGKGVHHRDDNEFNVTWSVKGNKITLQEKFLGLTIDYTGTFNGNELVLYNGDETNPLTYQYVYKKK